MVNNEGDRGDKLRIDQKRGGSIVSWLFRCNEVELNYIKVNKLYNCE